MKNDFRDGKTEKFVWKHVQKQKGCRVVDQRAQPQLMLSSYGGGCLVLLANKNTDNKIKCHNKTVLGCFGFMVLKIFYFQVLNFYILHRVLKCAIAPILQGSDCVNSFVALQSCIKVNPDAFSKDILGEDESTESEPVQEYKIIPPDWSKESTKSKKSKSKL